LKGSVVALAAAAAAISVTAGLWFSSSALLHRHPSQSGMGMFASFAGGIHRVP